MAPTPGARVVMRYRLPDGYSPPLTDVIGELLSLDPPTVRTADGQVIAVQPGHVVALKAIGPRPIRSGDIRALEAAAADAWPGVAHEWIDGWFVRAGYGFTNRANSAVPLGPSHATTAAVSLRRIADWYAEQGQQPVLSLPDRVVPVPPGWQTHSETLVLAADLETIALPDGPSIVAVDSTPSSGWFELHTAHDPRAAESPPAALEVLTSIRNGALGFASLGDPTRVDFFAETTSDAPALPLAIARGALTQAPDGRRWVGLSSVSVAEAHRRHGLGTLICAELLRWSKTHDATHAYAQVHADNHTATAMYRSLGFVDHHRYRYTTPPM